jgi:hypothetical protein
MNKRGLIGLIVLVVIVILAIGGYLYFRDFFVGDGDEDDEDDCLNARELFATEAEALEHAEKIGCSGSHMHSEYDVPYMACLNHQQAVNMDVVC